MKHKHSDSYRKNKCKDWKKRICPNCLMNFIRDPEEKLCKECVDEICDDLINRMENEEKGEQV